MISRLKCADSCLDWCDTHRKIVWTLVLQHSGSPWVSWPSAWATPPPASAISAHTSLEPSANFRLHFISLVGRINFFRCGSVLSYKAIHTFRGKGLLECLVSVDFLTQEAIVELLLIIFRAEYLKIRSEDTFIWRLNVIKLRIYMLTFWILSY